MKNFLFGLITGILAAVLCGCAYLVLGFAEIRGDLAPSSWETRLMAHSVHASVRREAPELPNPVPPTTENLIAGGKLFQGGCAGCHGEFAGAEDNGGTLFPPVPQLHKVGTAYTEAQIFWVAKHGIRRTGMFANGKWSSDHDLWTMAAYIKRAQNLPPAVRQALSEKPAPPAK